MLAHSRVNVAVLLLALANSIDTNDAGSIPRDDEQCDVKPIVFIDPDEGGVCTISEDCSKYPFYNCVDTVCQHKAVFP